MKLQRLLSYTRQAIDRYHMIETNDKIAVGISGGKDSLALLYALSHLQKFYPKKFELVAITVSLGFDNFDLSSIQDLSESLGVPYHIVHTQIGEIVFDIRKEPNPCSLCAKLRKGALNEKAIELGCNKIAYGHHKEDLVETMLMSLFYEGRINTFLPVTHLQRKNLFVIRPLMFVPEMDIKGFKTRYNVPVVASPCPANGHTKREDIKQLLKSLNSTIPNVADHIFHAIETGDLPGWKKN
jgi:tRNA 2-thiocytidine biosynthesis protein TtcA